jgi:hypothetical protein
MKWQDTLQCNGLMNFGVSALTTRSMDSYAPAEHNTKQLIINAFQLKVLLNALSFSHLFTRQGSEPTVPTPYIIIRNGIGRAHCLRAFNVNRMRDIGNEVAEMRNEDRQCGW